MDENRMKPIDTTRFDIAAIERRYAALQREHPDSPERDEALAALDAEHAALVKQMPTPEDQAATLKAAELRTEAARLRSEQAAAELITDPSDPAQLEAAAELIEPTKG